MWLNPAGLVAPGQFGKKTVPPGSGHALGSINGSDNIQQNDPTESLSTSTLKLYKFYYLDQERITLRNLYDSNWSSLGGFEVSD